MNATIRVWYDREGDFLEITFRDAKGYLREIAEDIYERVDEAGNLLGYSLFNVTRHERQSLALPVKVQQLTASLQAA
jgi:uncharacterized protein YuzE